MSFSAVASYSVNKGPEMLMQGYEDVFDEFIAYNATDDEASEYPLPDSVFLRSSESSLGDVSQSSNGDENNYMAAHISCQGDSWAMKDSAVASQSAEHFYGSERAATSHSDLLSLGDIHLSPRISLPPSPAKPNQTLRRKNRIVESLSKTFQRGSATLDKSVLRSPIRKAHSNPAMMRTIHHKNSNLDLWGQRLDLEAGKFDFDFAQDDAALSPPSARMLRHTQSLDPQKGELINGHTYKHALTQHASRSTICDTPLSTPTLGHYPSRQTSQKFCSDNALFPVTPQAHNSSSWSQLPGYPDFNNSENSTIYPEIEPPLWWNHASTAPMAQPSPNMIQTNALRSSKNLASQFQNDLAYSNNDVVHDSSNRVNGLMIQMPDSSAQPSFVMDDSPMLAPQFYTSSSRPQLHHKTNQHNRQVSYHARSRQHQSQPQNTTRTRKSRSDFQSSDSESPSPQPAAFQVRKRKTSKSGKQSTPRTPTSGPADFVNYTPSDSRKILTGVAPSGSSKTKARREKEADDKRRKLGQAAMRAVRAAGGDVESLVEQGLFV
ncbi:uncharacterized protein RCO7_01078 [Rhynchosporium graminicola]|uniref:Developmental regulatory protein wetA n=1 Tax=Rhynchosporium graminicola TaxID=2792576 RepID=A0A1E1JR41_9HELO|nr:uncharacterized protein RCO7_01078 [Rhynchosporium commune]